ncbi:DgyrCDS13833 [Dimorphilus gyrociliatus]|uniref:DgyrCDS13833 n=1 Tax=Dimorphilus gyrociliatus TaxID=2664684 RepID=A0A7I8WBU9_9ANNE|nr:DgyrCDS13833 [Dimorphilus gyrociliatus]
MSVNELYSKDARIWVADEHEVWKSAILKEDYTNGNELQILFEDGEESLIKVKSKNDLPPLRNPEILVGENDLTSLSYLHEPAVLHNLRVRFLDRNIIYTYCGIVLVAINPYQQLHIYDSDTMLTYRGQDMGNLEPHIFAVAEEAYKRLSRYNESQSIIVSGESGAGKTVSAKYAMRYFATIGGAQADTQIEKKVLSSNPIMEAIGNAKTTRNDNSSRFGKYIELGFDKEDTLIGAHMRTYLLEKSRVVFQSSNERNYHIFYQLCAVSDRDDYKELSLGDPNIFLYTNQGQAPIIDGVNDEELFQETIDALLMLGVSHATQMELYRIVAGILHLGNVVFLEEDSESCSISERDKHLPLMSRLFGVDEENMRKWLCVKKITTGNEIFEKPLSKSQAFFTKDALSKYIYSKFFHYIVQLVNDRLNIAKKHTKFIGVLDIYGFETFEVNSFEQFCINYANEKLQQQFCLHVFKLEQEEYVKEEIEWSFIDFYDNQPCIDLIEGKLGILELLDEECKMPRGSDSNWCLKLGSKHGKNKHFTVPRMRQKSFIIHHFADDVEYFTDGFLEKNRDTILEEQVKALRESKRDFIRMLFADEDTNKKQTVIRPARESQRSTRSHKQTVASQFKVSLTQLMETLFSTTPHYVRCIKPNDIKASFNFEPKRAVQQLRACGVLETIRISAAGYPSRWKYQDFFQRYKLLLKFKDINKKNVKKTSEKLLQSLIKEKDKYQFGKTQIFFRAGQVAYLEKLRTDKLKASSILIQKIIKGWLQRIKYKKIRRSILLVQCYGKSLLARKKAEQLRRIRACLRLQSAFRMFKARRKFNIVKRSVELIQTYGRAKLARDQYREKFMRKNVLLLQQTIKMWNARRTYKRCIKGIIQLQAHVRRKLAKREYKRLRIEARSVENIKKVAKGLENKVISLQMKIEDQKDEMVLLKKDRERLDEAKKECVRLKEFETESKTKSSRIEELQIIIEKLKAEIDKEREEKEKLIKDQTLRNEEDRKIMEELKAENLTLTLKLSTAKESVDKIELNQADLLNEKIDESNKEFEIERVNHQKVIKEYEILLQKYTSLQEESKHRHGHRRNLSDLSDISIESESGISSERNSEQGTLPRRAHSDHKKNGTQMSPADLSIISRLQNRVRDLESDKSRLEKQLEQKEDLSELKEDLNVLDSSDTDIRNAIRLQEVEMENNKLKTEITKIRASIAEDEDKGLTQFLTQFEAMSAELERRREECIQLRTMITSRTHGLPMMKDNENSLPNDDGELEMAYRSQKESNMILKTQIEQAEEIQKQNNGEITRLREKCDHLEDQVSKNLENSTDSVINSTLQHEVSKLTVENLDLKESAENQTRLIKKLKKALKIYAKKLKNNETPDVVITDIDIDDNLPEVRHHSNRQYLGMLEYKREDEQTLMRNLIIDLEPTLASSELPSLPAYILFMCIRHSDYLNDDEKLKSLMVTAVNSIKVAVKNRKGEELESMVLWLSNSCRLLNHLKQYSGESPFQKQNTAKQNEHCLRNFDLSPYRPVLMDVAVWIYQGLIKHLEKKLESLIVSAVLEHEAIQGLSAGKPGGLRGRIHSADATDSEAGLERLLRCLDGFLSVLNKHSLDPDITNQVFRQLFYFICANSLNNLLLRKEMCHWSKAMQIRYNVTHLEQWLRDNKLAQQQTLETLEPIIQASQLLQARKSEEDVDAICEMCTKLTAAQIIKILNLYTPVDEFEERVPVTFIRKMQLKLVDVKSTQTQQLLMDKKFNFAVTFQFSPTSIGFETIQIPDNWNLDFLKRL